MTSHRASRAAAGIALGTALALGFACRPEAGELAVADAYAVERAALRTLFLEREHARQLVVYRGPVADAPALGDAAAEGSAGVRGLAPGLVDAAALALPVPVTVVDRAALDAHFRRHPDAWAAWYRRFPASGGVIAVAAPQALPNGGAAVVVGRLCGEHCRSAWRVVVRRAGEAWRTDSVAPLALPRM